MAKSGRLACKRYPEFQVGAYSVTKRDCCQVTAFGVGLTSERLRANQASLLTLHSETVLSPHEAVVEFVVP